MVLKFHYRISSTRIDLGDTSAKARMSRIVDITDQFVSGEHLLHELKMFWWLVEAIPFQKDGYMHGAMLESFFVHLRNLIWFFCKGRAA